MGFLKYALLLILLGVALFGWGYESGYRTKEAQHNRQKVSAQLQAQKYKAKKKHEITRSVDSDLDLRLDKWMRSDS